MTLAIVGASYLQRPLVEKARELGIRTICFAWENGAVCKDICDVFYPISIVEKERILCVCRAENIDGICTIASDIAAPTVAYVAEKMRLVGNPYSVAVCANNKYLMRQAFVAAGILCPRFACVKSVEECSSFSWIKNSFISQSGRIGIIVKPLDRSGSLAVTKVVCEEELLSAVKQALDVSFEHKAMIEEFVDGREISVEFISYEGKHYPLQITDKVTTESPNFVELEHHQPAILSANMYKKIYAITDKALTALGVTCGASHAEYKITKDGEIVVIEIGARMGGDFIGSDLVRLSTGYDFVRGVIEVALGIFDVSRWNTQCLAYNHQYSGVYFLSKETENLLPIFEHWKDYPEIIACERTDSLLRNVTCSADRSGYFIYQGKTKFNVNRFKLECDK